MRTTFLSILFVFCVASMASAQISKPPVSEEEAVNPWQVSVGAFGGVVGSFMEEPSETNKTARVPLEGRLQKGSVPVPYPGFAGVGGGGGVSVDVMYQGIIGLELQLYNAKETAKGHLDVRNTRHQIELSKTAWHIPLLFKLAIPTAVVRPFIFGGFDFVLESEPEVETTLIGADALGDGYTATQFGFGFDFFVHERVRIPLMLRGSRNFAMDSNVEGLMSFDGCSLQNDEALSCFQYRTAWQWQAFVSLGVSYTFD